jgi:type II secretion system protein C
MNQYQLEVADMDRRHRRHVRTLSIIGSGLLAILALWSAGLPPAQWWTKLSSLFEPNEERVAVVPATASKNGLVLPTSATKNATNNSSALGTDASVSSTPLRLMLIETNPGRNSNEGTARIGTSSENPQTYSAGALLANGARLVQVHGEYVVLEYQGRTAKLIKNDQGKAKAKDERMLLVGGETPREATKPTVSDPLVQILRPTPVFDGNQVIGLEVYAGPNVSLFSQIGLQSGDILLAINGTPINDTKATLDLLRELTNGSALTASVSRKGERKSVSLDGSVIMAELERARLADRQEARQAPL